MAAELQQPEGQTSIVPPTPAADPPEPPPLDNTATTTTAITNPPNDSAAPAYVSERSVGTHPTKHTIDAPIKHGASTKTPSLAAKTSKTRPLTNLVNGGGGSNFQDSAELPENYADFSHREPKIKKPTKRARTNWNKFDSTTVNDGDGGGGAGIIDSTSFLHEENDNNNDDFREIEGEGEGEGSEPLLKEQQSPINSDENMGLQFWDRQRKGSRARTSEINGVHLNEVNSPEKPNEANSGVSEWLIGLGLGRYAPVFVIHEVDDEVLPMLTLEDLKDMGINAVGSRRKMYSSILKLRKRLLTAKTGVDGANIMTSQKKTKLGEGKDLELFA